MQSKKAAIAVALSSEYTEMWKNKIEIYKIFLLFSRFVSQNCTFHLKLLLLLTCFRSC